MFNIEQQKAITHKLGPVLCLAGPGSGKTTVLTHHIRYLILEKHINPSHILVITFSKAAAMEMQQRFDNLMENQYYPVRFGTFHAVFFQILSRYEGYTAKDILTLSQKKKYLKTVLLHMDYQGKIDMESLENILSAVSLIKNRKSTLEEEEKRSYIEIEKSIPQFQEIYIKYEALIRQEHKLDFDDMLLLCYRLLQNRPDVLEEYRRDMEYLLIDEYQDINPIQYEVVKLLIHPHRNLFAVGDDDQSIYGFRGSDPSIMLQFRRDFPEGTVITFPINYRCVNGIVKSAGKVISKNKHRYEKRMTAIKTGESIKLTSYDSKEKEYEALIQKLKFAQKEGKLNTCACLFRTNMDTSYLAEMLLKEKIPYHMKERPYQPYEHFICQDFLHYLRLKEGSRSIHELIPVMNKPLRYLSREAFRNAEFDFDNLFSFYKDKTYMKKKIQKLQYDLNYMKKMDLFASVQYIRKGIGYDEYLYQLAREQNQSAENYQKTADELQKRFALFHTREELEQHIENCRENIDEPRKEENKEGVTLMTYHASKGLEFDTVYLPDCNEGTIPYKKSTTPEQIEEERRLFYVAMTRAKENLNIMFVDGKKDNRHLISRFVKDI